jgi:hypothetical protein
MGKEPIEVNVTLPVSYVDPPDCPPGMTLAEYRRLRARPSRPSLRQRATRLRPFRSARRRRAT